MKIMALRFGASPDTRGFLRQVLERSASQGFHVPGEGRSPVLYIVSTDDLPGMRNSQGVIDKGVKNRHKGLSEYLIGTKGENTYLIDGNYGSSRQLERSVRTFLLKARSRGLQSLFIVGVSKNIFDEVWQKAEDTSARPEAKGDGLLQRRPDLASPMEEPLPSAMLRLMGRHEVPAGLVGRYIGDSAEVRFVRQMVIQAGRSDNPVLILGDSGTGKGLVAREIHGSSDRASRPFVMVNCGAIPFDLLETELFGHARGAFTGAKYRKEGLWESARNGTIFLDEIADLHPHHQVKILHALEDRKIRPVGATGEVGVAARVIAATNRDLFSMVQSGEFRKDLYYRLRGLLIRLPALREHPGDIPHLAGFFWRRIAGDDVGSLSDEILRELASRRWPGNARELKMVLSSLREYFGAENLTLEKLRSIFRLEGHAVPVGEEKTPEKEISLHRAECLRHLKMVDEAVRAAEVALLPVVGERKVDGQMAASAGAALSYRLDELEMLTRRPLLFHSEASFSAVHRLKGKLTYLQGLLQEDVEKARKYWKGDMAGEFSSVTSTIFKEVERVLEKA